MKNKDIIFLVYVTVWIGVIRNFMLFSITKHYVIASIILTVLLIFIVLAKYKIPKFNTWLEKDIKTFNK